MNNRNDASKELGICCIFINITQIVDEIAATPCTTATINQGGCSIKSSHLEHAFYLKDLYSYKIMTKIILVNSTRGTLKVRRNNANNENVWDDLTSGNSCRRADKNYLQSTFSHSWKECRESVKQCQRSNGGILLNEKFKNFFCYLLV